jgi:hypothetical protein
MSQEVIGKKEGKDAHPDHYAHPVGGEYGQNPEDVENKPQGCHIADVPYKVFTGEGVKGHLTPLQRDTENG